MIHFMGLYDEAFQSMKQGDKLYEVRLHDQKRKKLRKGDLIEFTRLPDKKETLLVDILNLIPFHTFDQLYQSVAKEDIAKENSTHQELLNSTYQIYTKDQEKQWGVLAIQVALSKQSYALRTIHPQ